MAPAVLAPLMAAGSEEDLALELHDLVQDERDHLGGPVEAVLGQDPGLPRRQYALLLGGSLAIPPLVALHLQGERGWPTTSTRARSAGAFTQKGCCTSVSWPGSWRPGTTWSGFAAAASHRDRSLRGGSRAGPPGLAAATGPGCRVARPGIRWTSGCRRRPARQASNDRAPWASSGATGDPWGGRSREGGHRPAPRAPLAGFAASGGSVGCAPPAAPRSPWSS